MRIAPRLAGQTCVLSLLAVSFGCAPVPPPPKFTLQRDAATSRILEPVDQDGYLDYLEATNQRLGKGVKPDDNWEVVVRRAYGPLDWDEASDVEYYRRLGIERLSRQPPNEPYIVPLSGKGGEQTAVEKKREEQFFKIRGPWRAEEYPDVAEWLSRQAPIWDRLVDESKRASRYYVPRVLTVVGHASKVGEFREFFKKLAKSPDGGERLAGAVIAGLVGDLTGDPPPLARWHTPDITSQSRQIARVLIARVYLRIGEGRAEAAQPDLLALHRIARLLSQGGTEEWLVGQALESVASQGDAVLLQSGGVSRESLEAHLADLNALLPLAPAADRLDYDCRHVGLDALQHAGIRHREVCQQLRATDLDARTQALFAGIDWNRAMQLFNQKMDKLVAAARDPDPTKRLRRSKQLTSQRRTSNDELLADLKKTDGDPNAVAELIATSHFGQLAFPLASIELRHRTRLLVVRAAYAAELHRLEHGSFPGSLEAFTSKLKTRPVDPFAGKPLSLVRRNNGIVIYSIGQNMVDDQGQTNEENIDADDIVVKLP